MECVLATKEDERNDLFVCKKRYFLFETRLDKIIIRSGQFCFVREKQEIETSDLFYVN
jgi:hypothetical protein